jgi:hypothetical protein
MQNKFNEALQQAQEELARIQERAVSLIKLIEVLKSLSGDDLYELTPPPGYVPDGLTAEIRKVLNLTSVHITPIQIRDSLIVRGFASANPKNLLISVHTVLGRMEDELDVITRDGKPAYKMTMNATMKAGILALLTNYNKIVAGNTVVPGGPPPPPDTSRKSSIPPPPPTEWPKDTAPLPRGAEQFVRPGTYVDDRKKK